MNDVHSRIEHTVVGPLTGWDDVQAVLDASIAHGMRACVPPTAVTAASEYAPGVELTTVLGFPHGQHTVETKCTEAIDAWKAGAAEIDLVPNLGQAVEDTDAFRAEIAEVAAAVPVPIKVILETPLFATDQIETLAATAAETNIEFLKTATGFTDGGATVETVELLDEYAKVKASGGIDSWAVAEKLLSAGADRIGTSSGDVIVEEYQATR